MESPYKGKTGLKRLINACGYSMDGFLAAYKYEDAFRQELKLALLLTPVAFYFGHTVIEKAILIACIFLVLIVELLNSAVEATVDRISLDHHLLSKRAKDICSAAVTLSLINFIVVWGLIFLQ
jgi:diacylglycerol kinase (ATP)